MKRSAGTFHGHPLVQRMTMVGQGVRGRMEPDNVPSLRTADF